MDAATHPSSALRQALATSLALAAVALAACGTGMRERSASADPSCDRPAAEFQQPPTPLTFRAVGATPSELDETVRILCARLAGSGTPHRVVRGAGDRVTVELPASSPHARLASSSLFRDGKLAFYDWEANVLGPGGTPAPRDRRVTGGPAAGQAGSLSLYDAVLRASRRPAVDEADNAVAGSRFYAVDAGQRRVLSQVPADTKAQALAALAPARRAVAKVYEVKPGTIVVQADDEPRPADAEAWYVLRDDAALRGEEIVRPRALADPSVRPAGAPTVTFEFTREGRGHWIRLNAGIVDRGRRNARSSEPAELGFQHFAVVLDDRILGVHVMDFRAHPEDIPRAGSQIPGGQTMASARQLAALLAGGPLPRSLVQIASG
jgi:SecD/SecF fusion protein